MSRSCLPHPPSAPPDSPPPPKPAPTVWITTLLTQASSPPMDPSAPNCFLDHPLCSLQSLHCPNQSKSSSYGSRASPSLPAPVLPAAHATPHAWIPQLKERGQAGKELLASQKAQWRLDPGMHGQHSLDEPGSVQGKENPSPPASTAATLRVIGTPIREGKAAILAEGGDFWGKGIQALGEVPAPTLYCSQRAGVWGRSRLKEASTMTLLTRPLATGLRSAS